MNMKFPQNSKLFIAKTNLSTRSSLASLDIQTLFQTTSVVYSEHACPAAPSGINPHSGQSKDYEIVHLYNASPLSTQHQGVRADWLVRNQDNAFRVERHDSSCGLLVQSASTIKIQLGMLVQYKTDIIFTSSKCSLFLPLYGI